MEKKSICCKFAVGVNGFSQKIICNTHPDMCQFKFYMKHFFFSWFYLFISLFPLFTPTVQINKPWRII